MSYYRQSLHIATIAPPALIVLVALAGCSGERFQLANRDDTLYERRIAENDVRVPVTPNDPFINRPNTAIASVNPPVVPAVPTPQGPEYASTYGTSPIVPPANETPAVSPLAQQVAPLTPRPGPPGTRLDYVPDGPELMGRVVNPVGQPMPQATIQVVDVRSGGRVVAEVAADDAGVFRIRNLTPGIVYQLQSISSSAEGRLYGQTNAVAPNTSVVIQLRQENQLAGRSPLGNRLSSQPPIDRPDAARPVELASTIPAPDNPLPGTVTVATIRATGVAPTPRAAPSLARVLPPQPTSNTSLGAAASSNASGGVQNIPWDRPPATSSNLDNDPIVQGRPVPPASEPKKDEQPSDPLGNEQPSDTKFAGQSDFGLDLPTDGDLQLPDLDVKSPSTDAKAPSANPAAQNSASSADASRLAFAGTGLEFIRVLDLDGKERPMGALAGDLILIDFFGSWCGPCRQAVPHLNEIYSRYASRGLRVVGVACEYGSSEEAVASANNARNELSIRYPVVVSPMDEPSKLRDYFHIDGYPTVVLIDRKGVIHFQAKGGDSVTLRRLEQAIDKALSPPRVASAN